MLPERLQDSSEDTAIPTTAPSKPLPGGQTVPVGHHEPNQITLTAAAKPDVVSWIGKMDSTLDLSCHVSCLPLWLQGHQGQYCQLAIKTSIPQGCTNSPARCHLVLRDAGHLSLP